MGKRSRDKEGVPIMKEQRLRKEDRSVKHNAVHRSSDVKMTAKHFIVALHENMTLANI